MPTAIQWHKLDRDRTVAMIDSVKTSGDHIMFSLATSEAKCAKLPFYKNILLYRLTNYSSLPSFSFDYLGDGRTFYYLDGGPASVYRANDTGNLVLNEMNVLDYTTFFFNHVSGPDGDVYVIDDPQDHPALDSLGYMQMDDILASHQAPEISTDADGNFIVQTSLYYMGSLVRATIVVTPNGRVNVTNHQMLLTLTPDLSETGVNA